MQAFEAGVLRARTNAATPTPRIAMQATTDATNASFLNMARMTPNDQTQRPSQETPGRLQESLTNYQNGSTAQRSGDSLERGC